MLDELGFEQRLRPEELADAVDPDSTRCGV